MTCFYLANISWIFLTSVKKHTGSWIYNTKYLDRATPCSHSFSGCCSESITQMDLSVQQASWESLLLENSSLLNDWRTVPRSHFDFNFTQSCPYESESRENFSSEGFWCDSAWDDVYCWPATSAGTVITRLCSEAFNATQPDIANFLEGYATRECLDNGTWSNGKRTNYDECAASYEFNEAKKVDAQRLVFIVQHILFCGSIMSIVCLTTSLAIFAAFRSLWCDRIKLLVNLMLALMLRFILYLVITEPFVLGRSWSYRDVEVLCKAIICLHLYATVTSVSWMFIQGLFLHTKLTTNVFRGDSQGSLVRYYFLGWLIPAGLLVIYMVAMIVGHDSKSGNCWRGHGDMIEIWILVGPMILALVLNSVFLLNILRILLEKVRRSCNLQSDSSQIMAAAKATLILSPGLGINNLLLLYNPGGDYEKYYVILNTIFGSTQGIFVSIFYCFNNHEVQSAIRRWYYRKTGRNDRQEFALTGQHRTQGQTRPSLRAQEEENVQENQL